jgi:hypothetical protein
MVAPSNATRPARAQATPRPERTEDVAQYGTAAGYSSIN